MSKAKAPPRTNARTASRAPNSAAISALHSDAPKPAQSAQHALKPEPKAKHKPHSTPAKGHGHPKPKGKLKPAK
jgi:hypothetical protein